MSAKKISMGTRPLAKAAPAADDWVKSRDSSDGKEPMKRLTIDVPESLHRAIKMACAGRGSKIADEVRELLNQKYGNA